MMIQMTKVPDPVHAKIIKDEFVDFREILNKTEKEYKWVTGTEDETIPALKVFEQPKGELTEHQWSMAFEMYAHSYLSMFPEAEADLRLYKFEILKLMSVKPSVWAAYDEAFRKRRKEWNLPFCVVDHDLLLDLKTHARQPNLPQVPDGDFMLDGEVKAARRKRSFSKIFKAKGFHCWAFNSNVCVKRNCAYRHVCAKCKQPHPIRDCPSASEEEKRSGGRPDRKPSVSSCMQ